MKTSTACWLTGDMHFGLLVVWTQIGGAPVYAALYIAALMLTLGIGATYWEKRGC